MKAIDFVNTVATFAPSEKELLDYGLTEFEAREIQHLFLFELRKSSFQDNGNDAKSFFRNFETKNKAVGKIRFFDTLVKEADQIIFAKWETELFYEDSNTKRIFLKDEKGVISHYVGRNFEHFLDVVHWSAYFLFKRKMSVELIEPIKKEMIDELTDSYEGLSNKKFLEILFASR